MKPKDILGLILRLLGVLFLYRAVEAVPMVWRVLSMGARAFNWSLFIDSIFMVAWQGAAAYWLIRGAPPLLKVAYPDSGRDSNLATNPGTSPSGPFSA